MLKEKTLQKVIVAFTAGMFGIVAYKIILLAATVTLYGEPCRTDVSVHLNIAKELLADGFGGVLKKSSYPLWDLNVNLFYLICKDWNKAAAVSTALVYVITFGVFWWYMKKSGIDHFVVSYVYVFFLMVLQPITRAGLMFTNEQRIQMITTWHNPTNIWPRLFALPIIWLFFEIIEREEDKRKCHKQYICLCILMILVNLGKPSFSQVFLPSIVIYCILYCIVTKFEAFGTCLKLAIASLPSVAILLLQMIANLYEGENSGGIEIAWYKVLSVTQKGNPKVIVEAIAFPLVFSILYFKKEYKKPKFLFMWLFYAVSFLEFALLTEKGVRTYHGNFGWGYTVAIMLLHAYMLTELYRNGKEKLDWRLYICAVLILLHFICGISWMYWQTTEMGVLCQIGAI